MNQNLEEDINNKEINNMKTLREILETSVLDIEGIIKDGDNILNLFNEFKKIILDKKSYKRNNRSTIKLSFADVDLYKSMFSVAGIKNINDITIFISKRSEYNGWSDEDNPYWEWEMIVDGIYYDAGEHKIIIKSEPGEKLTVDKFIKLYIAPEFANIETFISFVKHNMF